MLVFPVSKALILKSLGFLSGYQATFQSLAISTEKAETVLVCIGMVSIT
jgi:hypothetical protein